jgi:hypothetical protein
MNILHAQHQRSKFARYRQESSIAAVAPGESCPDSRSRRIVFPSKGTARAGIAPSSLRSTWSPNSESYSSGSKTATVSKSPASVSASSVRPAGVQLPEDQKQPCLDWLSERVVRALERQRERQHTQRLAAGPAWAEQDLVFTRATGQPLRHEFVLRQLHQLAEQPGLPRIRVRDLRHFAATTMLSTQVPLGMASKTMRHSILSTTTEIYGHLLRHAAHQAVEAIDNALTTAENALPAAVETGRLDQPRAPHATTMRPPKPARSALVPAAILSPRRPGDISPAACDHNATTTARH